MTDENCAFVSLEQRLSLSLVESRRKIMEKKFELEKSVEKQ